MANGKGAVAHVGVGAVDPAFWQGKRVLLTGHTGFKGAWMALWLQSLGADVVGFSLGIQGEPSLYDLARVGEGLQDVTGDVRDHEAVVAAVRSAAPEIVIHMAAQALVRRSFTEPRNTYETNVMGTVNVLDAVRLVGGVRAVVSVTSDKCYENREWEWGYRENEPLGGYDPYSSSKGCAELVTAAYTRSFFSDPDGTRVASARAGNVIGGGDWGEDRLVPDLMRAAISGTPARVRNPNSIRPWQHVLNPVSGYLVLAQSLTQSAEYAGAWNFGPPESDARSAGWLVEHVARLWPGELAWTHDDGPHPHEARYLKLDSSKARGRLGWRPPVDLDAALEATVAWYAAYPTGVSAAGLGAAAAGGGNGRAGGRDMRALTMAQIESLQYAPSPS